MRDMQLISSICLGLTLAGCKVRTEASTVKYGHYPDSKQSLVYQPDGATITACGFFLDDLSWAINVWGAALGRTYRVVQNCERYDIAIYGPESSYAKTGCDQYKLNGRSYAFYSRQPREIVNCPGAVMDRKAMLHEVGHLFGMCDQYEGEIKNCASTTAIVPGSVMHSANSTSLTDDDVEGIRALARKVAGEDSQPPVALLSGLYTNAPLGNDEWQVAAESVAGRTETIKISVGSAVYQTTCNDANICTFSNASAEIRGTDRFDYVKNGKMTRYVRHGSLGLTLAGEEQAGSVASGDSPTPKALEPRFLADDDTVLACTDGNGICDDTRIQDRERCLCRYYFACEGLEVLSYCMR